MIPGAGCSVCEYSVCVDVRGVESARTSWFKAVVVAGVVDEEGVG